MRVLLMLAHSVEEWHQVRLMHELGHEVFSIGAYINPAQPLDDKRPALPQVPLHADLKAVVDGLPVTDDAPDRLWNAKDRLPDELLDWADVVICHHVEWRWLIQNWTRMRAAGCRVIWRTVGQSTHENEQRMRVLRREGLQIVRYSPREAAIPYYAGHDAIIRFYGDPAELQGWTGEDQVVGNVTQRMKHRGEWTGWHFWQSATSGLPAFPAGPESDTYGGVGSLTYPGMLEYLRRIRTYLYTGTFPASYTLGLVEAMMTGVPVVAASGDRWRDSFPGLPYGADLYEAADIAVLSVADPDEARALMKLLLVDRDYAADISARTRARALELFALDRIADEWRSFLG